MVLDILMCVLTAVGADGDSFHVRGWHNHTLCILSATNLSLNALFHDVRYRASWSKRWIEGEAVESSSGE